MTGQPVRACWCGGELGKEIGEHYRCCNECGAAVLAVLPPSQHFDVSDDEHDFYGRQYWTEYSRSRHLPDIGERVRSDLAERCVFWLERVLDVVRPPGRCLEIGCGHGAFVCLLRELGFDAMGTELSGWVVDFAKRTFDVPVLRGRLETLVLESGFKCIAAFDVLEHLADPLETLLRCRDLLAPDGVLLLQTPWYRGEGPDWSMFQADEHIHLFTEGSIRLLLSRAGFQEMLVRPSLFPYDMWVVATRSRLPIGPISEAEAAGNWRPPAAFRSLLDLSRQVSRVREDLAVADADRAARLAHVEELTRHLQELEEARLEQIHELSRLLRESEADRAARLEQIHELSRLLRTSEADRAARLEALQDLQGRIAQIKGTWIGRLYNKLPSSLTGRKPVE